MPIKGPYHVWTINMKCPSFESMSQTNLNTIWVGGMENHIDCSPVDAEVDVDTHDVGETS